MNKDVFVVAVKLVVISTVLKAISEANKSKEVIFTCSCGWTGIESDLDLSIFDMVCCPVCHNDDVRVLNDAQVSK